MNVIIILLVILVLFIINKKSNFVDSNELISKLYNGDKYNGYRLADIIFYPDYLTRRHNYSTRSHLYKYPDTIGVEYIRRKYPILKKFNNESDFIKYRDDYLKLEQDILSSFKSNGIDMNILNGIIEERTTNSEKPGEDTLYLHMRVGDVLCKYPKSYNHSKEYAKRGDTTWWNSVIDYIKQNGIKKVVIIAGTHFKECLDQSAGYILEIANKLYQIVKVDYRIGNSPDDDLIFSRNAKHFITTGGGYGYFLGKIVELNGGKFALNQKDTVRKDRVLF
jgi:hypothetical protein